ncbi:hypothetical protein [Nocardia yunnanensis]|uniref:hypothetical protein n=1 Tax=Nocardia yunnanensis TaxID=2382165 RepID=UPI0013C47262|nr:hypothetical protein [Nocardia yunnanensis]
MQTEPIEYRGQIVQGVALPVVGHRLQIMPWLETAAAVEQIGVFLTQVGRYVGVGEDVVRLLVEVRRIQCLSGI